MMMSRDFSKHQTVIVVTDSVAQVPDADAERLYSLSRFWFKLKMKISGGWIYHPDFIPKNARRKSFLRHQPSPADYLNVFRSHLNKGTQAIIHLFLPVNLAPRITTPRGQMCG